MDQGEKERLQVRLEAAANQRFPGAVQAVLVVEHGDEERHIKPGQMLIRVVISPAGPDGHERTLRAFGQGRRPEMEQFRRDLSQRFPRVRLIQFTMADRKDPRDPRAIMMPIRRGPAGAGPEAARRPEA